MDNPRVNKLISLLKQAEVVEGEIVNNQNYNPLDIKRFSIGGDNGPRFTVQITADFGKNLKQMVLIFLEEECYNLDAYIPSQDCVTAVEEGVFKLNTNFPDFEDMRFNHLEDTWYMLNWNKSGFFKSEMTFDEGKSVLKFGLQIEALKV